MYEDLKNDTHETIWPLFVKLKGVENELFFETKTSSLARRFSFKKQFVFDPLLADLTCYFQHVLRHALNSSPSTSFQVHIIISTYQHPKHFLNVLFCAMIAAFQIDSFHWFLKVSFRCEDFQFDKSSCPVSNFDSAWR